MDTLHKILQLLEKSNVSDSEFAKVLKIYPSAISEWKKGKTKSYLKYIDKIADYFGVSTDYLLGRTNSQSSLQIPELTDEDDGLIFSINGTNEKIALTPEQIQKAKELLKIAMPEQFNKDSKNNM